jgi:holo-[acyl-carrier protein] synthase
MLISQGIDIVNIKRIARLHEKYKFRFLKKIFSSPELKKFDLTKKNISVQKFSNRFAAKEAASKALGKGFSEGIRFVDIQVYNNPDGKPFLKFAGNAYDLFKSFEKNGKKVKSDISMSNEKDFAIAIVSISLI